MAKPPALGTCRLCRQERVLCDSHVIPELAYAPTYDDRHKAAGFHVSERGVRQQFVQKGLREKLLCQDCEGFLNTEYE